MQSVAFGLMFAVAASLSVNAHAQTAQGVVATAPGVAGAARMVDVTATITAIDAKTRAVTLKGPQGREAVVVAGPEVKNFAQLKVGDQVDATYAESLVLELKKGNTAVPGRTETSGAKAAAPGSTPGAVAARKVTIVGEVIDLDAATQTVVVKGPNRVVDLKFADPEQFKLVAKGDKIEATYQQALAVAVRPKK